MGMLRDQSSLMDQLGTSQIRLYLHQQLANGAITPMQLELMEEQWRRGQAGFFFCIRKDCSYL